MMELGGEEARKKLMKEPSAEKTIAQIVARAHKRAAQTGGNAAVPARVRHVLPFVSERTLASNVRVSSQELG